MNYEIITREDDLSSWNYETLEAALREAVRRYDGVVYTDEASAKSDKAELNKIKKLLDTKRKEYKKICLAPYNDAEIKIKALTAIIDEKLAAIGQSVEDFEAGRKSERDAAVRSYYDKKSDVLGIYADKMFERIKNPKWYNASAKDAVWQKDMIAAIETAADDIRQLRALSSPYLDTLIDEYINGSSLYDCIEENQKLTNAVSRAGINVAEKTVSEEIPQQPDKDSFTLRLKCSPSQKKRLLDFIRMLGIKYEEI